MWGTWCSSGHGPQAKPGQGCCPGGHPVPVPGSLGLRCLSQQPWSRESRCLSQAATLFPPGAPGPPPPKKACCSGTFLVTFSLKFAALCPKWRLCLRAQKGPLLPPGPTSCPPAGRCWAGGVGARGRPGLTRPCRSTTAGRAARSSVASAPPGAPPSPSSASRRRCACASPATSSSTSESGRRARSSQPCSWRPLDVTPCTSSPLPRPQALAC